MTSQPRKHIFPIHVLPNISRSKWNQIMKFGWLIEYNTKNIFLVKKAQNVVPDPFLKNKN